jgi:RHS repeat-associated protein
VVKTTNAGGSVTSGLLYDPNGLSQGGGTRFTFTARELDSETGLIYLRNRYYDPTTARFVSEDPSGHRAGVNLYRYAGNSPVNYTDPFGLYEIRNFPAGRVQQLKEAVTAVIKRVSESCCAGNLGPKIQNVLNKTKFIFQKGSHPEDCGSAYYGWWFIKGNRIYLHEGSFTSPQCPMLECTIIHEATHIALRTGRQTIPFAMERSCFGCQTPPD